VPWDFYDLGDGPRPVASKPAGGTSPGTVRVVADPAGSSRKVIEETVTPAAHASDTVGTDSVYLWNAVHAYAGHNGQEDWERFRIYFPRTRFVPNPSCGGGCPWLAEHHNNSASEPFMRAGRVTSELPELAWGVITDHSVSDGSVQPQLFMRVLGGRDNTPSQPNRSPPLFVFTRRALRYDHWYDFLVRVRWSPDSRLGLVAWWLDNTLVTSVHHATLWMRPDGSIDAVNFELNNYRPHMDVKSTIYYGRASISATRR
jgi:hypothetical protein